MPLNTPPPQSPTHHNCMSLSQFVFSLVSVKVKERITLTAAWDLLCQSSRTFEGASSTFHSSPVMSSAVEGLHLCFYVCVCVECSHGLVDWYYLLENKMAFHRFRIKIYFVETDPKHFLSWNSFPSQLWYWISDQTQSDLELKCAISFLICKINYFIC